MHRLSSIILLLLSILQLTAQTPHGESFKVDCASCHDPFGWEISMDTFQYNHDTMNFVLEGTHLVVDCKACHTTLVFNEAPMDCISCHEDIHNASFGNDCVRCHTTDNWLVDHIPELHEANGFALVGGHGNLSCVDCHASETNLRFDRIGNDCFSCHQEDYMNTQFPNHLEAGFHAVCSDCHNPIANDWNTEFINHDFFPLTLGHDIADCTQCHLTTNYADISPECVSCHQEDYTNTTTPNHMEAGFSTNCAACHTIDPGWTPARFADHDEFYPLVGEHAAIANECAMCHDINNYSDVPNTCVGCHLTDYNNAQVPNHIELNLSHDCASCHTPSPEWTPATFDIHDDFYPLVGAHAEIATDCAACHNLNDYSDVPNTCIGCHQSDYNNAEPNHAGFPTDCLECHNQNDWEDANFDHDGIFPIYSGTHQGEWNNDCTSCHFNPNDYNLFSCIDCHEHNDPADLADEHNDVDDYEYVSQRCFECHPDGKAD